jgi:Protein-tyrosine-phosphatase-like, N-terminal domain
MTEPIGIGGVVDTETALHREVEVLAQRFPGVDRRELDRRVRDTFAQLKRTAQVEAHLLAVTRAQVTEQLRREGAEIHVRSEATD